MEQQVNTGQSVFFPGDIILAVLEHVRGLKPYSHIEFSGLGALRFSSFSVWEVETLHFLCFVFGRRRIFDFPENILLSQKNLL